MNDNTVRLHNFIYAYIDDGGYGCFSWNERPYTTAYIRADVCAERQNAVQSEVYVERMRADGLRKQLDAANKRNVALSGELAFMRDDRNLYYATAKQQTGAIEELNARIAELEAAQAWVSVDERLPDDDEVLTYERDQYGYDMWSVDGYSLVQKRWLNDSTPTHWIPLPPPPVTAVTENDNA